ncbi:tetratricopeptide repeat protein, partial [Candidatus Ozemobacteraceae bacterium]|nr:tetratricopeptide repeat protein [Candidatus Ozemobacteraceae bacterium]
MNNDEKKNPLEKIDPSDVRVLAIGLILLIIPVIFLVYQSRGPKGGFSSGSVKERLASGRGGFSFIQKSGGGKQAAAAVSAPPKIDKQWNDVVQRVTSAPPPARMFEGYPPTTREYLQAQYDPRVRRAGFLFEQGNPSEAVKILQGILEEKTDNPFLYLAASHRLCRHYQATGMKDLEEKEFARLLEIMQRIPEMKNVAQYMRGCMEFVRKSPDLIAKYSQDPAVNQYLQDYTGRPGMPV